MNERLTQQRTARVLVQASELLEIQEPWKWDIVMSKAQGLAARENDPHIIRHLPYAAIEVAAEQVACSRPAIKDDLILNAWRILSCLILGITPMFEAAKRMKSLGEQILAEYVVATT